MKAFILSALVCLSACAVGVAPTTTNDNSDAGPPDKTCRITNAMYQINFHRISGDCPGSVDLTGELWMDQDGKPVFPPNCADRSQYATCTTFLYEDCKDWVYDSQIYGQMNWMPDGKTASGTLTFSVNMIDNGAYYCSSEYQANYQYLWEEAR